MIPVGAKKELSEIRCEARFVARYEKTNEKWWELKAWRLDFPNGIIRKWDEGPWRKTRKERGLKPRYMTMGWPRVVTKWDESLWLKLGESKSG